MRRVFAILICSLFLNAVPASAQSALSGGTGTFMDGVKFIDELVPPLVSPTGRAIADVASWGTAGLAVALDTKASWQAPDRTRAFVAQGVRIGVTYALVFTAKKLVSRRRPCSYGPNVHGYNYANSCGVDNPDYSFYSAHTAVAAASGQPVLAGLTAAGRVLGAKHWVTDTLMGFAAGTATHWLVGRLLL